MTNPYCHVLGIDPPRLAEVADHKEAGPYARLLVALLEKGGSMTLEEAAARFADAGLGSQPAALRSLQRCRPDRPPVYRHGESLFLDPFDSELSLWVFRLGLRPPRLQGPGTDADPEAHEEHLRRLREHSERQSARSAALRRAVVRAFPPEAPEALVLLDADGGGVRRFAREDLAAASAALGEYDVLAGEEIRPTLLGLGMDLAARRLHELRPPQKTITTGPADRVLAITTERLLEGSCGIRRRWGRGRDAALRKLLDAGRIDRLLDRLQAEAVDLAALYHYGLLHGALRLRWRNLDEMLRIPWVETYDEWQIGAWLRRAGEVGQPVEVVAGAAPDPASPWSDAEWCTVYRPEGYYWPALVTARHELVQVEDVQRLRMARPGEWHAPLPAEAAGPSTALGSSPSAFATDPRILRIRITLELERAPVWRTIEVPAGFAFWDLHVAIQDAMGWHDAHLHVFRVTDPDGGDPIEIGIPIDELMDDPVVRPGWRVPVLRYLNPAQPACDYVYDFGDDWQHRLQLEAIEPVDPARRYPRCVAGARARPPEDVGGAHGYERFLEALADASHEDHRTYLTWVGGHFDPDAFDTADPSFDSAGERWAYAFALS